MLRTEKTRFEGRGVQDWYCVSICAENVEEECVTKI